MSASAVLGLRTMTLPISISSAYGGVCGGAKAAPRKVGGGMVAVECSSRPRKKATSHHMKTRPKKTQPWDIRRRPTVYPPLPPLPPDWTLLLSDDAGEAAAPSPAPSPPAPSPRQQQQLEK